MMQNVTSKDKMESDARIDVLEQRKHQLETELEQEKTNLSAQVERNTQACLQIEELSLQLEQSKSILSEREIQLENEKTAFANSQSSLKVKYLSIYFYSYMCFYSNLKRSLLPRRKP